MESLFSMELFGTTNLPLSRTRMVRFDPKTEKFQSWAIPAGGGVVRNMMTTRDGNIVIAESALNIVGLVQIGK